MRTLPAPIGKAHFSNIRNDRSLRSRLRLRVAQLALAAIVVPLLPLPAAQRQQEVRDARATVSGQVLDDSNRPLAGATISVPALQRMTATNDSGRFVLPGLPPTELILEIRRVGYRATVRRIDLTADRNVVLTFRVARAAITVAQVVVTGSATASERRGAQDVASLGEAELRASGTASLGRTLEKLPGVSNMSGGPAAGNPVLRGLSQSRIRIVRDGVPQESFEASPRWFPPGNLSSVDRIEVIRGPASILYGSNALGGAINIVPRALPVSDTSGLRLFGLAETQYFSNNNERYVHGELAGARGVLGVRVGGARRIAGEFRTPPATPYAESQVQGAPRYAGRIRYSNYEQTSRYAQAGLSGTWGNVRALYDGWEGYNNFPNANGKPAGVHSLNGDARVQGSLIAGTFVVRPSVVVQRVEIERAASIAKSYEVASDSALWDQNLVNRIVTARLELSHPEIAGLRGTIGAEYSGQHSVTHLSQIQPTGTIGNAALFVFEEVRAGRLTLTAGGRGDWRSQRAQAGSLVNALPETARASALSQRFQVVTGSFGAAYELREGLSASANLSSGFRAPSFLDLYTNENRPALGGWVEGNPGARAERSTSVEGGVHYASNRANFGIVGYRNSISNFTYLSRSARTHALAGNSLPVFSTVQARARLSGIEPSLSLALFPTLVIESSYARIASRNMATGEGLPLMPADLYRGSLRYAPKRIAVFELPYAQLGFKHAWAKGIAGPTEPFADGGSQGYGIASTPAYSLLDLSVGGQVAVGASAVEVVVTVDNALDTQFRDFLDSQKGFTLGLGRNVGVRVAVPLVIVR